MLCYTTPSAQVFDMISLARSLADTKCVAPICYYYGTVHTVGAAQRVTIITPRAHDSMTAYLPPGAWRIVYVDFPSRAVIFC